MIDSNNDGTPDISIHTLTRRVTRTFPRLRQLCRQISIHTLTRRVTTAFGPVSPWAVISIHTLTRRVTRPDAPATVSLHDFNPHPHTEGDLTYEMIHGLAV